MYICIYAHVCIHIRKRIIDRPMYNKTFSGMTSTKRKGKKKKKKKKKNSNLKLCKRFGETSDGADEVDCQLGYAESME